MYFSHDTDARNDLNIIRLRIKKGWAGYGLFWAIIEVMAEAPQNKIKPDDIEILAYDLRADQKEIVEILEEFSLFKKTDAGYFSESLNNRLNLKKEVTEKRKKAASKRWEKPEIEENF